jgi:outer membrane protein
MKLRPIAATSAVLILSCAAVAQAQTPAARPAGAAPSSQNPPPQGAALPGVCVISNEGAVYSSAAGKAMLNRLSQLNSQAEAEIKGQQTSIQNDAKTLETQKASLPADQYQQRGQALQQRVNDLQRTAQVRQREMQLTQEKALQTFGGYLDPVMRQVFTQRSCSVLLNENALVYPAPAMDITRSVVQGLDAKVQTFSFDREHVDPNAPAPTR